MTIENALRAARRKIERADAEILLAALLAVSRTHLHAFGERALAADCALAFAQLVERRALGEPIAYLLGRRDFHALTLEVSAAVLIPRADTETLVELALAHLPQAQARRVLDLGCGSGAVGLALKAARPDIVLTLIDQSAAALAQAKANADRLGCPARLLESDWFAALEHERFDMVLSNPPYLAADDPHLREGDLRFEPRGALVAGPTGLECFAAILREARLHLAPGGLLAFEHGAQQGASVRALLSESGLREVKTRPDLAGLDRVSFGWAQ